MSVSKTELYELPSDLVLNLASIYLLCIKLRLEIRFRSRLVVVSVVSRYTVQQLNLILR